MSRFGLLIFVMIFIGLGCSFPARIHEQGLAAETPLSEPSWVRNGEPIEIENSLWYPTDEVERLMDGEMYLIGRYRDIAVYIERTDVKPFARVYTWFESGRYRAFEPHNKHD